MAAWYICLICDGRGGTLLRLKPAKIYACYDCVKKLGGRDKVTAQIDKHIDAFMTRHKAAPDAAPPQG